MIADMPTVQPFYVTGLPRSRTAWLSVALADWRISACLHEPLVRVSYESAPAGVDPVSGYHLGPETTIKVDDVSALLSATHCPFAGISDSGLPVVAPELPALLPGPVLVVWRNPKEVTRSLHAYLGGDLEAHAGAVLLMADRLNAFCRQHVDSGRLLYVDFDALSDMATMRSIWQHLLPGVQFQRRRIEALQRLHIEPDRSQLLSGATDSALAAIRNSAAPSPSPARPLEPSPE